ncbi:Protein TolB [compost metagenome]
MSRIFLSHSSTNNAQALALGKWLETQGWSDYFLDIDEDRGIAPGERWMAALAGAVDRCEAVIFLVSPAWRDSKYCFAEFYQAKNLGKRIFGVIVEPIALATLPTQMTAEWQVCDLTDISDQLIFPVELKPVVPHTHVGFPHAGLDALARGLRKAGLDPATFVWPPEHDSGRSPYPGLRALEEDDAAVFFGREAALVRAIDQLRRVRERGVESFFIILGASGAGKSSFLRAGLVPRLRRDTQHWVVLPTIRPERCAVSGSHGLVACLKAALSKTGESLSNAQVSAELINHGLAGFLHRIETTGRSNRASALQSERTLVFPIDQAEELFAADGHDEAQQFLHYMESIFQSMPNSKAPSVLLIMAIRSDSLSRLQDSVVLQARPPVLFSLPAMPATEFKSVIEGPAKRHSDAVKPLIITAQLTEELVRDAQGAADALPLLALTLEWLYREFTTNKGTQVGHEEYRSLGGIRGVINKAAQRAMEQPDRQPAIPSTLSQQERLLRQLFPLIATVDPDNGEWKRRIALRQQLQLQGPQVDAVVSRLIEQRLLLTDLRATEAGTEPVEVIEVAHEALLRQWEPLERCLREFATDLSAAESIRRATNDWARGNCDKTLLIHTAHRLQAAEALFTDERMKGQFKPQVQQYLSACRERDQDALKIREQQLRRVAWGLLMGTFIVLVLAGGILMQTREVSRQSSLVIASAAENAADQKRFDQSVRLSILATRASWLRPAHATARPALARALDANTLLALLADDASSIEGSWISSAMFSADDKHIVTTSSDGIARIWDTSTGLPVGKPMRHGSKTLSATFSHDGQRIVTASVQGTAQVWDINSSAPIGEPMKHAAGVNSALFSPDGKRVVTASADGTAHLWDASSGSPVGVPMAHENWAMYGVKSAVFSPNNKFIVTFSDDKTARVWDADTGSPVGAPMTHDAAVNSAMFSSDSQRVVTASDDKTARIWNVGTGLQSDASMIHDNAVKTAELSPDDKRIVTVSADGVGRVWETLMRHPVGRPIGHDASGKFWLRSAKFSPDSQRIVTASNGGTAQVWDASIGIPLGEPMTHVAEIKSATFSNDGQRVITTSFDGRACVWKSPISRAVGKPMTHLDVIRSAHFSPDSQRVITASADKTARLWEVGTGLPVGEPMVHEKKIQSAQFSHDGNRIVTASLDGTAHLWNAITGLSESPPLVHGSPYLSSVLSAEFSPDDQRLVTASLDGTALVWNTNTNQTVGAPMEHESWVNSAVFSPDNRLIVTASKDTTARLWNADTGEPVGKPMTHDDGERSEVTSAVFSPDGQHIVTVSVGGTARIWNVDTSPAGKQIKHDQGINSAAFSADSRRIVTTSQDSTARTWDANSGLAVGEPMIHKFAVMSAEFSPDDQRVVTASVDWTARAWDANTGKPIGEPIAHDATVNTATFSPDGQYMVTTSGTSAQVWRGFAWPIDDPEALLAQACSSMNSAARRITTADVRLVRLISPDRIGSDVCEGLVMTEDRSGSVTAAH